MFCSISLKLENMLMLIYNDSYASPIVHCLLHYFILCFYNIFFIFVIVLCNLSEATGLISNQTCLRSLPVTCTNQRR